MITGPAGAAGMIARTTRATGMAAGSTRASGMIAGSPGSARATWVIAGSTGSARATGMIAGATRSARATRSAGTTRIVRTSGCVAPTRRHPAVVPWRLWRSGSSVGKSGAHPQGCSAQRSGDGHPSDKLLQLHNASPIH